MASQVGQLVRYVRASAADQNEARQLEALGAVDRLLSEKFSGKDSNRAQPQEMLAYVRAGDMSRVKLPDRLARSTTDPLSPVDPLERATISAPQSEGIALANAAACTRAGPNSLQTIEASARVDNGAPKAGAARGLCVSRQTLYAALNDDGRFAA